MLATVHTPNYNLSSRWGLCPVQQTLDVECGRHCSTPWERLSSTAFSGEQSKLHFLDLQRQGRFTKAWPAFFSFYVEAGLLICIFFCGQVSFLGRSLQRSAVVEVGPAELEASIRGGGAVILDIFAIWCFGLKSQQFFWSVFPFGPPRTLGIPLLLWQKDNI